MAPLESFPKGLGLVLRFALAALLVAAGYEGVQFVLDGLAGRYVTADGPTRFPTQAHR